MSWSIQLIGKSENVADALLKESEKVSGQSKVEFDTALPHLIALVKENFGNPASLLKITANGHGYAVGDEQRNRNLNVTIENIYGTIV